MTYFKDKALELGMTQEVIDVLGDVLIWEFIIRKEQKDEGGK